MSHGGSQPITLPLSHVAWRRAAVKAAAAFGRRALRPADAVRAIGEACDCAHSLAREILAAGESFGLLMFTGGRWSVAEPAAGTAPAATRSHSDARQARTGGRQGVTPCQKMS